MTFDELADWYVDTHRKPDGTALRGAARRNLRTDVGHLKDVFGGMTVKQITPDVISNGTSASMRKASGCSPACARD